MAQMPFRSSGARTRLEVSPGGELFAIVAVGSIEWARPRVWPASWVMVFCTSIETQLTMGAPGGHCGASAVVKVNLLPAPFGALLISMSASRICPVETRNVVSVVAMVPNSRPLGQQSYLLLHPPSVMHGSPGGTTPGASQRTVRKRIKFRLYPSGK